MAQYTQRTQPMHRRSKWIKLIGREDLINKTIRNIYVCEIHFNEQDIKVTTARKTLQKGCSPCLHLPSPTTVDKTTQTEIYTIDSSIQTTSTEVSSSETMNYTSDQQTGTSVQVTDASHQGTMTLSQEKNICKTSQTTTQTSAELSADTPRKRKLNADVSGLKKRLRVSETEKDSQKEMFHKLSDRLLSTNLAELVKAQTHLKSSHKGNPYNIAYKMFCLNLYYVSPQAYRLLGKTLGFPSRVTLNKVDIPISTQINDDLMAALKLKVDNMSEREKHCSIVVDAMSLETNLFYDIKNDKIIGFHEIDGVQSPIPAEYALVVLIRGIFVKWSQPIGFALLSNCKNDKALSQWIDKIISKLFEIGLIIRIMVSDLRPNFLNAAKNRGISTDKTYFEVNDNKIYYIFDATHLIKLVRNNLMAYDFHFQNDAVAKFEHIAKFYELDKKKKFRQAYKLTNSHIRPSKFEKMKVRFATQLLSQSVASGLSTYVDFGIIDQSAKHTVEFVKNMNDLFDVLNSSTLRHCNSNKNAFRESKSQIDLFNNMLMLFQTLKLINPKTGSDVTKTVKFINGFQITMRSILNLFKDLKQEGFDYLQTRNLNQDVLEQFFCKIRTKNGMSTEPTSRQFVSAFPKFVFANMVQAPKEGNCADDLAEFVLHLNNFKSPVERNDNNVASVNGPGIIDNDLREIVGSDYRNFEVPEQNAFFNVCGALLSKCIDRHDCKLLEYYLDNTPQNLSTQSAYLKFINFAPEKKLLVEPPDSFVKNIEKMEYVFKTAFEKEHINCKIGMSIYEKIQDVPFFMPCPCFPKQYLQKLYIRMRIYLTVRMNNKGFRTSRNRRKYFSAANL